MAALALGGETWVDFRTPDVGYSVSSAAWRAGEAERQAVVTPAGLRVRVDADRESAQSPWFTMSVPPALGAGRDWRNARFELVLLDAPSGRCRSDVALNFVDEEGETFQFLRKSESYGENGEFRLLFDLAETRPGRGWGGANPNNVMDGALHLNALNLHFNAVGDDPASRKGEAVFIRIEECPRQSAKSLPRTVVSREAISTDVTYPGAAPFPGAESLAFAFEPAVDGPVALTLSYGSVGTAEQGWKTNFTAVAAGGRVAFDVALPYDRQYQFIGLSAKAPVRVLSAEGVFRQTAAEAMRVRVETGNRLGLVRDGKGERPAIHVRNPSDRALRWKTAFRLKDFFGRVVDVPFDRAVAPGEEVRLDVPWPLPGRGIWFLEADVAGEDGSCAKRAARFAWIDLHERTAYVPKPKFRLGIHYHGTFYLPDLVDPTIDALVAAGAKFVRTDYSFLWRDIERSEGVYTWEKADDMLARLRAAGLALDIIFASSPGWAVTPAWREACPKWEKAGREIRWGFAPTRPGLFRSFCEKFARRYGTAIDYYETGNEWDISGEGVGPHDELLRMQREAYEGLHAGCPGVCVTPNGWAAAASQPTPMPQHWNTGLIELFARHPEFYDAWAFHSHGEPLWFQSQIRDRFLPLRASTPLATRPWLCNETALTSHNGREKDVAAAVWQKILYAWAHGSADYIWYNLRATGWFDGAEPGYGLMTADLRPRAGYAAFAALSAVFQGLDGDGVLHSDGGRQMFRFKGRSAAVDGRALAGWWTGLSAGQTIPVEIRTDARRAVLCDLMGNRRALQLRGGVVAFPVAALPQALLLEGATRADPVDMAVFAKAAPRTVLTVGDGDGGARPPDLRMSGIGFVRDLYEADPANVHRLWKGDADNSAKLWLWRAGGGLRVRAVVCDDVSAPGDGVTAFLCDGNGGARRAFRLGRVSRNGVFDVYEGALPAPAGVFGLDVRVDDDDGEGVESRLELCRPGTPAVLVRCE